jgi:hypothetical protein
MFNFAREIAEREKIRSERLLRELKKNEVVQESISAEKVAANIIAQETKANEEKLKEADQDRIVYKVQIGSFLNGKLSTTFKTMYAKLSKFRKIEKYTDAKKYDIYTIGNFTEYNDAALLKNQLILEGAKGAFLAAYKNGERIPISKVVKKQPGK